MVFKHLLTIIVGNLKKKLINSRDVSIFKYFLEFSICLVVWKEWEGDGRRKKKQGGQIHTRILFVLGW